MVRYCEASRGDALVSPLAKLADHQPAHGTTWTPEPTIKVGGEGRAEEGSEKSGR